MKATQILSILSLSFATQAALAAIPCGTQGTIEERIVNCATPGSTALWISENRWNLVARNSAGKQLYRDEATGLVWSDVSAVEVTGWAADNYCGLTQGVELQGFGLNFRVPSVENFQSARGNGLPPKSWPGNEIFWTSEKTDDLIATYNLSNGETSNADCSSVRFVRCIVK